MKTRYFRLLSCLLLLLLGPGLPGSPGSGLVAAPAPAATSPEPAPALARAYAAAPPTVLRDTARTYALGGPNLAILRLPVPGPDPTLAQLQAAPWAGRFAQAPPGVPNYIGDQTHRFWLRVELDNRSHPGTGWVLETRFAENDFAVYVVNGPGQPYHAVRCGPAYPPRNAQAVPSRFANVGLALPPGRSTLYVHCGGNLFRLHLRETSHQLQTNRLEDLREALYFGILLALLLYNLGLFLSVRDVAYLYYSGFVASFGLLQACMMNYLSTYVWPLASGGFYDGVRIALLVLVMGTGIRTAQTFLVLARYAPRLHRALNGLLWGLLLLPASAWLEGQGYAQVRPVVIACEVLLPTAVTVLALAGGTLAWRAGYRPARYYMLGWACLLLGTTGFYLRLLHLIPVSFYTDYGTRISSVLDLLLISLGLADRINVARRERQQAVDETLLLAQEKEAVQRAANQALTRHSDELQLAYDELQTSLRTTETLTERDELKTRFFTNISHELRTPLTLLLGPLDQLLDTPAARPLAAELGLMHRHGGRLLALINQLLDVARLEAGQLQLRAAPQPLRAFVAVQVAAFQSHATDLGLTLEMLPPDPAAPPLPEVWFDADQLEKVLTNLLGNALKFTPAGGCVTVAVGLDAAAHAATVRVADTGCGIPAAHLPLIFDRFHQVDDSSQRPHEGTGIGLALVKELVSLHQGTVAVASTVGQGTAFTIGLPLGTAHLGHVPADEAPAAAAAGAGSAAVAATVAADSAAVAAALAARTAAAGSPAPAPAETLAPDFADADPAHPNNLNADGLSTDPRPLVLIIDDHADMRAYLARCLGPDYRLATAPDGRAGLARATDLLPDLVLSDLMMPHLDGLELCHRLKTDERTSHIPVVLLTARAAPESRLQGYQTGADDYLTKPFRPQELRVRVANLLAQRQLLRQRFAQAITLQPRDISITSADEQFLTRALAVVERHFANPAFDVETFADEMALSRVHLFRKLKALTDQAPTDFVRVLRLRRAAQLLAGGAGNVSEVAYAVGFDNLSYFGKRFRELHGHAPSEHAGLMLAQSPVPPSSAWDSPAGRSSRKGDAVITVNE